MARITVEDCLSNVDNVFQLVVIASKRARQIYNGSEPKVPVQGDKPTVLALREVAAGVVKRDVLEEKYEESLFSEAGSAAEEEFLFDDQNRGSALFDDQIDKSRP